MSDPTPQGETETSSPNTNKPLNSPMSTASGEPTTRLTLSPGNTSQLRSASGSRARDISSATFSTDDSLPYPLDLLPQNLVGGGVSAMSSRRPSYAAEFSSRPKLLDLPNPSELATASSLQQPLQNGQQNHHLFQSPFNISSSKDFTLSSTAKPAAMPLFETDRWSRSSDISRSIWFNNNTGTSQPAPKTLSELPAATSSQTGAATSSPGAKAANVPASPGTGGSIFLSPLLGNATVGNTAHGPVSPSAAPHGSQADFSLDGAIGSQRNFRSVSFSHTFERRPLGSRSPPKSQALGSFYEDSVGEATDVLGNTHIDDTKRRVLRPQTSQQLLMNPTSSHSLWFNENSSPTASASNSAAAAAAAAALNRRHSFATTIESQLHSQELHTPRHASTNLIQTPVTPAAVAKTSPPNSTRTYGYDESHITGVSENMLAEVSAYFNSDEFGRNQAILNADDSASMSPPSAAGLISAASSKLCLVQFKSCRVDVFFIPETSSLTVKVDDLVIVDADRGRDLGKVIRVNVLSEEAGMLKWRQHLEQQAALQQTPGDPGAAAPNGPSVMTPKQILRFAQPTEIQQILSKQTDEEKAIKTCSAKVQEKGLAMAVLDAEYQWDRRKLTFFYSASYRIDFRDLVRDLFRIYKTRIWMCAVHTGQVGAQQLQQHPQPPQYRHMVPGPPRPFGNYGYPQEQSQHPDFAGASFSPWQFNPPMQNRMMVPPQEAPPPQYWPPMMFDHFGPPSRGPAPGSMVPGGDRIY